MPISAPKDPKLKALVSKLDRAKKITAMATAQRKAALKESKFPTGNTEVRAIKKAGIEAATRVRKTTASRRVPESPEVVTQIATAAVEVSKVSANLVERLGEISAKIVKATAQNLGKAVSDYSKAISEDISVNKRNLMALSLSAISPIAGYFASKFFETEFFQNIKNKFKEKASDVLSLIGEKIRTVLSKIPVVKSFVAGISKVSRAEKTEEIPQLQHGGVVKKAGLAKIHAAEVIGPIDKVIPFTNRKWRRELIGDALSQIGKLSGIKIGFNKLSKYLTKQVFGIFSAIGARIGRWKQTYEMFMARFPIFRDIKEWTGAMYKFISSPFRFLFKVRGYTYAKDIMRKGSLLEQMVHILATTYVSTMYRYDYLLAYLRQATYRLGIIAQLKDPSVQEPSGPMGWRIAGKVTGGLLFLPSLLIKALLGWGGPLKLSKRLLRGKRRTTIKSPFWYTALPESFESEWGPTQPQTINQILVLVGESGLKLLRKRKQGLIGLTSGITTESKQKALPSPPYPTPLLVTEAELHALRSKKGTIIEILSEIVSGIRKKLSEEKKTLAKTIRSKLEDITGGIKKDLLKKKETLPKILTTVLTRTTSPFSKKISAFITAALDFFKKFGALSKSLARKGGSYFFKILGVLGSLASSVFGFLGSVGMRFLSLAVGRFLPSVGRLFPFVGRFFPLIGRFLPLIGGFLGRFLPFVVARIPLLTALLGAGKFYSELSKEETPREKAFREKYNIPKAGMAGVSAFSTIGSLVGLDLEKEMKEADEAISNIDKKRQESNQIFLEKKISQMSPAARDAFEKQLRQTAAERGPQAAVEALLKLRRDGLLISKDQKLYVAGELDITPIKEKAKQTVQSKIEEASEKANQIISKGIKITEDIKHKLEQEGVVEKVNKIKEQALDKLKSSAEKIKKLKKEGDIWSDYPYELGMPPEEATSDKIKRIAERQAKEGYNIAKESIEKTYNELVSDTYKQIEKLFSINIKQAFSEGSEKITSYLDSLFSGVKDKLTSIMGEISPVISKFSNFLDIAQRFIEEKATPFITSLLEEGKALPQKLGLKKPKSPLENIFDTLRNLPQKLGAKEPSASPFENLFDKIRNLPQKLGAKEPSASPFENLFDKIRNVPQKLGLEPKSLLENILDTIRNAPQKLGLKPKSPLENIFDTLRNLPQKLGAKEPTTSPIEDLERFLGLRKTPLEKAKEKIEEIRLEPVLRRSSDFISDVADLVKSSIEKGTTRIEDIWALAKKDLSETDIRSGLLYQIMLQVQRDFVMEQMQEGTIPFPQGLFSSSQSAKIQSEQIRILRNIENKLTPKPTVESGGSKEGGSSSTSINQNILTNQISNNSIINRGVARESKAGIPSPADALQFGNLSESYIPSIVQ